MAKPLKQVFQDHRNPDGSYDGAGVLSDLSGLSREEIKWMWDRSVELARQGVPSEQRKAIVMAESKLKPWETRQ